MMESAHEKLLSKGIQFEQEGDYMKAEGYLNDAIDVANASATIEERAICYCHLVVFLERRGRTEEAAGIRHIMEVLQRAGHE